MTNQQLKAHCEDVIANPQDHPDWVVDMARVALASLEAVPSEYRDIWDARVGKSEALELEAEGYTLRKLYDAPPVPELKPIDFKEDETAFEKGVSALIDCLEDCGDAEQGLRLALRAMTGVE